MKETNVIDFPNGQAGTNEPFEDECAGINIDTESILHELNKLQYMIECLCFIVGEVAKSNEG